MGFIDLHTHSDRSDGTMKPRELVRYAKSKELSAIALTDHDTVSGLSDALDEGNKIGIEVVPGIEFSAISENEIHILGFYIDYENSDIKWAIKEIADVRDRRNEHICKTLRELGIDVTVEEAQKFVTGDVCARGHIAMVMIEKGYVKTLPEAFEKYFNMGRPAYFNKQRFTPKECVELITNAGGLAFIAHPHLTKLSDDELIELLKYLKPYGLKGIEGYYNNYTPEMQKKYQNMAKDLGLAISGGTDFHAGMKPYLEIGTGLGNMQIPYSVLENIKTLR